MVEQKRRSIPPTEAALPAPGATDDDHDGDEDDALADTVRAPKHSHSFIKTR
jgi:hypothetical protein